MSFPAYQHPAAAFSDPDTMLTTDVRLLSWLLCPKIAVTSQFGQVLVELVPLYLSALARGRG